MNNLDNVNDLDNIVNFIKNNPNVSLSSKKLKDLLDSYSNKDWETYQYFNEKEYTKNLVFRNNNFEIFIVCWDKYQGSKIHDHAKNGCILKILKGKLIEYRYDTDTLKLKELSFLPKDSISYIDNDIGYHSIKNSSRGQTVSLHIYSPPNYEANVYLSN